MVRLIQVTRSLSNSSSGGGLGRLAGGGTNSILINTMKILQVEDAEGREEATSKIIFDNGKILYVEESMNEIMDATNAKEGGLFG